MKNLIALAVIATMCSFCSVTSAAMIGYDLKAHITQSQSDFNPVGKTFHYQFFISDALLDSKNAYFDVWGLPGIPPVGYAWNNSWLTIDFGNGKTISYEPYYAPYILGNFPFVDLRAISIGNNLNITYISFLAIPSGDGECQFNTSLMTLWGIGASYDRFSGIIDSFNQVPEPCTIFLMSCGLVAIVYRQKLHKRSKM